jgi:hypothetical protein
MRIKKNHLSYSLKNLNNFPQIKAHFAKVLNQKRYNPGDGNESSRKGMVTGRQMGVLVGVFVINNLI